MKMPEVISSRMVAPCGMNCMVFLHTAVQRSHAAAVWEPMRASPDTAVPV